MKRFLPDAFTLCLLTTVLLASILPAKGEYAVAVGYITQAAIALLFFMHGAKLSRQAIVEGSSQWRLHLVVMLSTFALFPVLGLALRAWAPLPLPDTLYSGFMYLCILPATVQSAIAFTSIAGGNVAAAVCSASASSLIGIFISPLLAGTLMKVQGSADAGHVEQVLKVMEQLLLPFVLGHLSRPWTASWIEKHRKWIGKTDQSSILLVVYSAFSEAVLQGLWHKVGVVALLEILVLCLALLAVVLVVNTQVARRLGFNRADEITLVFCGSKKSLANGIPMANILFPAASVGLLILPLMLFHQVQIMVCAYLARRYREKALVPISA
ncbi:bile acid:sodium symporter family protein [Gallaecimonas pentaromativorans]|uniref:bile acid:sodium symporter family protein n=1 Tax=Gallaecimonas pentaromativorans TaxID=584787 RepID=UPI00067ECEB1|nr:bile acid:sodium symporter family protein [Gallaecimonas pentaromativorans]